MRSWSNSVYTILGRQGASRHVQKHISICKIIIVRKKQTRKKYGMRQGRGSPAIQSALE